MFNASAETVGEMKGISEAAGSSAEKAAEQLSSDATKVSTNLAEATESLGAAKTDIGAGLDTALNEASKAIDFAKKSLEEGDITAAVQTMSLVESVTDLALASVPSAETLDMSNVDFEKDFSPEEMTALSTIAGQMGVGKVVSLQKMAGQMSVAGAAGFDAKGMMGNMDAKGIGFGSAIEGMASAGMVDVEAITGSASFDMDSFNTTNFSSMNIAEMGMNPTMMAGALTALPVGSATAALETLQSGAGAVAQGFENMDSNIMNSAIASTMSAKGMGAEMMSTMGDAMGVKNMADLASGMEGAAGLKAIGEAMSAAGAMDNMAESLSTAFSSPETGITSSMNASVGMISSAISGKAQENQSAVQIGNETGEVAKKMTEAAPDAVEMPESVSESGMMMGAMVMAEPMMAGGLPGAMAPPEGMTAESMLSDTGEKGLGDMMSGGMESNMEAMSSMTGMSATTMSEMGIDKMAEATGLTPGMVATMGSAGIAGMDVTSVMSTSVAGLGSKAVADIASSAAGGSMSGTMLGDMMETGLVNQGTMAAMGAQGMEKLSSSMGMEGGDMSLAAASGGLAGMGEINAGSMDPDMAKGMGLENESSMSQVMEGIDGTKGAAMNLGQVSAAMGTGATPEAAIGSAAKASEAANESGAGITGAAMGAAASAQGAAAAAMGAGAVGGAMGEAMGDAMGGGTMGEAMGESMMGSMSGAMGAGMAGAMGGMTEGGAMGDIGGAMGGDMAGGAMGEAMGGAMGEAMGGMGEAVGGAVGGPGGPGDTEGPAATPGDGDGGRMTPGT